MKLQKFNDEAEWLDARKGRITGTRLKDIICKRGGKPKIGFYEIIAERVAIPANGENVMDRGHRLEVEAIERFEKETGKVVNKDLVMIFRDDDDNIAYSPDGFIGKTEDVEVKCLSSARHIEAYLTKAVPADYEEQILQGFIVNDKLKTRHMVFYDPRMPVDFFYLTINREDVQDEITEYLELERQVLSQIAEIEKQLTF
jgi:hypothetical protein